MQPALSIVFFTTLSGAGYGLLTWLGISVFLLQSRGGAAAPWASLQLIAALLALVLVTAGLLCSLLHLGQPQRAWRALSQWRTSWLSREGIMALLTYLPALTMTILLWRGVNYTYAATLLALAGVLTTVLALATVACTAMIYASLKPIPAWRHPLVVPAYLVLALLSGAALLLLLMQWKLPGGGMSMLLPSLLLIALIAALVKFIYWREIDRAPLPADRAAAVGLPGRSVQTFEAPHTEANYITREMVFRIARQHATRLRLLAYALFAGVPLLLTLLWMAAPSSVAWTLPLATASILSGVFVERWLFFAEARHVVSLYY
ncbi:MAG: dimethyl sulfoxide reductase anchor subunit [Pseudomonadota bacterium]|nr:dimethyl sulfoxide reductase anchor subunit [Pseudomonadota bacterium]